MPASSSIQQLAINTIRTLSMDGVQRANSGHPGTPMALAPVVYALWSKVLRYDPSAPNWMARDRFVLSCGHASMLLYSILHLAQVKHVNRQGKVLDELAIPLDHIRNFRQLGSRCAGHPEYGDAPGIETTTGPLGQGIGNSVGMAAASKWMAAKYNRPGFELFQFNVYALCSDGDVMEGIGCEAASIAGHLGLSNLCWIYDDNRITIEGETELAFSEDVETRFRGLGWNTVRVEDANDLDALHQAFLQFQNTSDRPTLIIVRSVIGFGSPNKANTHGAHGAPLGDEEVKLTKRAYGWPEDQLFHVPEEVTAHFQQSVVARGNDLRRKWDSQFQAFTAAHPAAASDINLISAGQLPADWENGIPTFAADAKGLATRVSSGKVLNALATKIPWLIGGSADLAPSTMTLLEQKDAGHFSRHNYAGKNFHFGIREHGMAALCNGLSLCGIRPYCATFFVFTDYLRPSMRLSSIMHRPVIYVLTHDSIGLGEDGPTHQPVEHLAACRAIPGLDVVRPADANEVAEAYRTILQRCSHRPVALVLSRQNVPTMDRSKVAPATGVANGGYTLIDSAGGKPDVILIGTGSELPICVSAAEQLASSGVRTRVVSMPCCEWFDAQSEEYRNSVLPPNVTVRVAVEAGIRQSWDKYLGSSGRFVGMSGFGASAPFGTLYKHFGITAERVVEEAKAGMSGRTAPR